MTPIERFEEKYMPEPNSGCWLWTAYLNEKGYGVFTNAQGWPVKAHRWSYEQFVGPIPDGLHIDHLCRVRCCVNPGHLEPVTCRENLRRGTVTNAAKSSCPKGHPYSDDNVILAPVTGYRKCKICTHATWRRSAARKKLLRKSKAEAA